MIHLTKKQYVYAALICVVLFMIWLFSGGDSTPEAGKVDGIEVSELLSLYAFENCDVDYCDLLSDATDKKREAIRKISLLDISGDAFYDHGCVIVDLIDEIGEEKYIESLGALTWEEERKICDCILAGLEYGNGKHQSQKLEDAFPKITALFSNPKKTNNK